LAIGYDICKYFLSKKEDKVIFF